MHKITNLGVSMVIGAVLFASATATAQSDTPTEKSTRPTLEELRAEYEQTQSTEIASRERKLQAHKALLEVERDQLSLDIQTARASDCPRLIALYTATRQELADTDNELAVVGLTRFQKGSPQETYRKKLLDLRKALVGDLKKITDEAKGVTDRITRSQKLVHSNNRSIAQFERMLAREDKRDPGPDPDMHLALNGHAHGVKMGGHGDDLVIRSPYIAGGQFDPNRPSLPEVFDACFEPKELPVY